MKRGIEPSTVLLAILLFGAVAWAYYLAVTID